MTTKNGLTWTPSSRPSMWPDTTIKFTNVRRTTCVSPTASFFAASHTLLSAFESWDAVDRYPYVIGDFVWSGFDYLGKQVSAESFLLRKRCAIFGKCPSFLGMVGTVAISISLATANPFALSADSLGPRREIVDGGSDTGAQRRGLAGL